MSEGRGARDMGTLVLCYVDADLWVIVMYTSI